MPRRLLSRLRAECSGSANKTFDGLKGPERRTKLVKVMNGSSDVRNNGQSEKAVGRTEDIFGVRDNTERIEGDLIEAERALNREIAWRRGAGRGRESVFLGRKIP